jgi:hypothetical protein
MRVDQILGLEQPSAVLALVAAGAWVVTMRALAFDIGVRQEAAGDRIEKTDGVVPVQQPLVQEHHEFVLNDFAVILRGGGGVQVIAHTEIPPVGQKLGMVPRGDFSRRGVLLVGADRDGCAVGVGARDHQNVVAAQTLIAREDVRGHIHARQVPDMQ